jgi:hypothetical protein
MPAHLRLGPVPLLGRRQVAGHPPAAQMPLHGLQREPNRAAACDWVIPASTAATTRSRRSIEEAARRAG